MIDFNMIIALFSDWEHYFVDSQLSYKIGWRISVIILLKVDPHALVFLINIISFTLSVVFYKNHSTISTIIDLSLFYFISVLCPTNPCDSTLRLPRNYYFATTYRIYILKATMPTPNVSPKFNPSAVDTGGKNPIFNLNSLFFIFI